MCLIKLKYKDKRAEAGNIFVIIFGAVALIAALNFSINLIINGPLSTAVGLGRLAGTEAQLLAHANVILSDAVLNQTNGGDIDSDGFVEPREYETVAGFGLIGGGAIPDVLGLDDIDAWGSQIGYCVWDHGGADTGQADNVTTAPNRRQGAASDFAAITIALVSPGQNRQFNTQCLAFDGVNGEGPVEEADTDDIILALSYAEAAETVGGTVSTIWQSVGLTEVTSTEIDVNVTSSDPTNPAQQRNVRVSGDGEFIALRTSQISSNGTSGGTIIINDTLRLEQRAAIPQPGPIEVNTGSCDTDAETMTITWNALINRPELRCF